MSESVGAEHPLEVKVAGARRRKETHHGGGVFSKELADGRRSFFIRYRFEGRKIAKRVGNVRKGMTGDALQEELARLEAKAHGLADARRRDLDADAGYVPPEVKAKRARAAAAQSKKDAPATLGDLVGIYRRECLRAKRRAEWQGWMLSLVEAELGKDTALQAITPERIEQWRDALVRAGKSASTVRKYVYFLSGIFADAMRTAKGRKLVQDNPCRLVALPSEPQGLRKALNETQAAALLVAAREDPPLYRWAAMMLYTGMRTEEAMRLLWRDADVLTGRIAVHDTKTGLPRYPEAGENLLPDLQAWHKADDPHPEEPVIGEDFSELPYARWRAVFTAAKLTWGNDRGEFTPRNLRTTFCMLAFQNGARPEELVQQTGHSLATLFRYYAEASREQRLRAVNAMPNLRRKALRAV